MAKQAALICRILLLLAVPATTCSGAALNLTISATILSNNQCKFKNPSSRTLAFGDLNPLVPVDVTRQATLQFSCFGKDNNVSYAIGDDDGLHEAAPDAHRMLHATLPGSYLPYTFSVTPGSGTSVKNAVVTLTVTGTVRGSDYQLAPAGSYADRVVVTIVP